MRKGNLIKPTEFNFYTAYYFTTSCFMLGRIKLTWQNSL